MVVDRIFQIIEYKGITKTNFYREVGLSNGFLDKVKDVGVSKLDLILKKYPEISPEWLITGKGEMLKNNDTITQATTGDNNISIGKGSIKGNNTINSNTGNDTIKQLKKELEDYKNLLEDYKKMISEKDNQINKLLNILAK
ncbi:XRE family transcriptional regulator [Riemerella anatipestifer]|nr:XRE family transcriptional regulator [Riemerella anatipestifer]